MALTQSQQLALNKLYEFVVTNAYLGAINQYFKLSGAAGSGKTYLICQFIDWYNAEYPNRSIALVTPSHKARRNAQKMVDAAGVKIETISTLASFLGLAPDLDPDNGKEIFRKGNFNRSDRKLPGEYNLIFIDEAWMIDGEVIEAIDKEIRGCKTLVIFVGDCAQLPPIKDEISWLETYKGDRLPSAYLNEVVRYNGDLAQIAHTYRVKYELRHDGTPVRIDPVSPSKIAATQDGTIVQLHEDEFIANFCNELINNKEPKLIAWRNQTCDSWNSQIRKKLHKLNYYSDCRFDEFLNGDLLIARKPIERTDNGKLQPIYENSTEFKVAGYSKAKKIDLYDVRLYWWEVQTDKTDIFSGENFVLNLLSEDSRQTYQQLLKSLAAEAKKKSLAGGNRKLAWGKYFNALRKFDDVVYGYAITNHKAQGSTLDSVYLDLQDLAKCSYKNQAIYTAMTRSKQLYISNKQQ